MGRGLLCAYVSLTVILSGCRFQRYEGEPSVDLGKELYQKQCQRCHGLQGTGSDLAPFDLKMRPSVNVKEAFHSVLIHGVPNTLMQPFGKHMSEEERESIRIYLLSLIQRTNDDKKDED